MLGKPLYSYGQPVQFEIDGRIITGKIAIVDAYGTFFQTEEVSYDVLSEEENMLYKHIPEPQLMPLESGKSK